MRRGTGFFITLEGPEGSGKSSQSRRLVRTLRRDGRAVVWLRDPGSTRLGRQLRQVLLHTELRPGPLMEALLFIGGRVRLVEEQVQPALAKSKIVICDRFHDATVVYQGYGGGLNPAWLDQVGRRAIHHEMPQLTIVLDVPTAQGFSRLRHRHDRMERKVRAFHARVRAGYRALAKRQPRRMVVVDASRPAEAVWQDILRVVQRRLFKAETT